MAPIARPARATTPTEMPAFWPVVREPPEELLSLLPPEPAGTPVSVLVAEVEEATCDLELRIDVLKVDLPVAVLEREGSALVSINNDDGVDVMRAGVLVFVCVLSGAGNDTGPLPLPSGGSNSVAVMTPCVG